MDARTVSDETRQTIQDLLIREVARFGLTDVSIRSGEDHSGDPALFVDATYGDGDPIDPQVLAKLPTLIRSELWARGERRFPFLRHHTAEDARIVGFP